MKAFYIKKCAFVWLPAINIEQGVYEYYILPTCIFTVNKEKKFKSLTLYWFRFAVISIIKTV